MNTGSEPISLAGSEFKDVRHVSIFGFERDSPVTVEQTDSRIHPEGRHLLPEKRKAARAEGEGQDYQIRLLMPDDSVRNL